MEKKHEPNSHEGLNSSWSELPVDLLSLLFERLGVADFQRGKSVCTSWYYASKQVVRRKRIHWLILFHKDDNYCTLLNPEEKHKRYKTKDLGLEFSKSECVATYGSWLLMGDPRSNLYIVNLFTQERMNLPPMEPQFETRNMLPTSAYGFHVSENTRDVWIDVRHHVFWIDEKTKDYVVLWVHLGHSCVVYSKKGDTSWNRIPETSDLCHMVYEDQKLYFLSRHLSFKIFEFSGEIPQEFFQCSVLRAHPPLGDSFVNTMKLVVTVAGDVLVVEETYRFRMQTYELGTRPKRRSFRIYKIYSSGFMVKCEQVNSVGDEAILYDQGITVVANDIGGFSRNSIYLDGGRPYSAFSRGMIGATIECCLFNLETQKLNQLHKFDCSSIQFSRARWFFPSFTR